MNESKDFCFCTLAVGERYRQHTKMLAQDIQQYTPNISLCVLTDYPDDFQEFPQVMAFKHQLKSVNGYHDKRFVLDKALSLFESCMFIDSDVRILGNFFREMNWSLGITARAGCSLINHMKSLNNPHKTKTIQEVSQKLNIDLQKVQWFHEFMFVMRRQDGLETEFFALWQNIAYFFEMRGIYNSEGVVMGLAAAKLGIDIGFFRDDIIPFFKDNIESVRIKQGQSALEEKKQYFDIHEEIEHPQRSLMTKIIGILTEKTVFLYRVLRLRFMIITDADFQSFIKMSQ
ncbi:hypothetical protein CLI64_13280 [Nostoc sp. CENA543]|uniref:hypothetical protein n=1 Tax=Nostoc sp. CENA543 TaxID=1869241 RepID=UPI000CA1139A|nr:hypothetical protein [Nostoc sp. CENA543]AUT01297.1 hypothetical protein CLI64_13280 [Nostoc sp. CENA543]